VGDNAARLRFCQEAGIRLFDAEYSKLSLSGAHHFGCVGVGKAEYCILNKQYPKEEYETLRKKIITHMNEMPYTDRSGHQYQYGEFFPPEMSPFAYNETLAQNFFPKTDRTAREAGYAWRTIDRAAQKTTMTVDEIPDHIKDATDDILKEVIKCPTCPRGFRIIKMELDLLRRMNVPLPRRCPMCRIEEKLNLWVKNQGRIPRTCPKCSIVFESKYAESEALNVLCKKCYNAEVA
jgi:hypothetical protein